MGIGHEAAGDDQRNSPCGAFAVERGHPLMGIRNVFQPGMHGTHEHAIAELREPQVEGLQQVRVLSVQRQLWRVAAAHSVADSHGEDVTMRAVQNLVCSRAQQQFPA